MQGRRILAKATQGSICGITCGSVGGRINVDNVNVDPRFRRLAIAAV
jgi:hypothetical protein